MSRIDEVRHIRTIYRNWLGVLYNLFRYRYEDRDIAVRFRSGKSVKMDKRDAYIIARYAGSFANVGSTSTGQLQKRLIQLVLPDPIQEEVAVPIRFLETLHVLRTKNMVEIDADFYKDLAKGIVNFKYKEERIRFESIRGKRVNGALLTVFVNETYKYLNPVGSTVIDIGANIGDSSVFFILNGAVQVVSLEPYPYSYGMLENNVSLNNLHQKITTINAGYGKDGIVFVSNAATGGWTPLEVGDEVQVKIYSLRTLIVEQGLNERQDLFLKMDCEGCERYLLEEEISTLRSFTRIIMEYHDVFKGNLHLLLKEKLTKAGFEVKFTGPNKGYNPLLSSGKMQGGILFAEKK